MRLKVKTTQKSHFDLRVVTFYSSLGYEIGADRDEGVDSHRDGHHDGGVVGQGGHWAKPTFFQFLFNSFKIVIRTNYTLSLHFNDLI